MVSGVFAEIQKDGPLPLYYQIKQMVLEAIQKGELSPGALVPGEMEFCQRYGISRPTVRQAMSELVAEGYLERQKGRGTFVARPKIDARFLNKLQSFGEEMLQKGVIPSTKVLHFGYGTEKPDISAKLGLKPADVLFRLERVRSADGVPVVYVETYFPYERFRALEDVDFVKESLYNVMRSRCGADVMHARREIEAVVANAREAYLLEIPRGSAVCLVKSTGYTGQGEAVEYSIARYRGDRTKFSVELCR